MTPIVSNRCGVREQSTGRFDLPSIFQSTGPGIVGLGRRLDPAIREIIKARQSAQSALAEHKRAKAFVQNEPNSLRQIKGGANAM